MVAAMLRAFLEGGADAAAFSVRDPATLDAIKGHLKNWGLDADRGVMEGLVPMVLGNMTSARGGIDMARLRRENRQVRLSLAGRVALGEKARALRETGRGRLAARQAAAKLVSGGETLRDAFRREGVRGLMAGAARPGQGFVYDRTRGVVLDSGRVFSPLDSRLVTRLSVGSPLTARMEALRGNSMAVSNMGGGIYQVLLKGRAAVNVAAGLNIPLAAGFSVKAGAGMGGERCAALYRRGELPGLSGSVHGFGIGAVRQNAQPGTVAEGRSDPFCQRQRGIGQRFPDRESCAFFPKAWRNQGTGAYRGGFSCVFGQGEADAGGKHPRRNCRF